MYAGHFRKGVTLITGLKSEKLVVVVSDFLSKPAMMGLAAKANF